MGSGEPPTCAVPLFSPAAKIHPSVALSNDKEFRPLRRATADRGGSDELLKKLEQNFQIDSARQFDKSKFDLTKKACTNFRTSFLNRI